MASSNKSALLSNTPKSPNYGALIEQLEDGNQQTSDEPPPGYRPTDEMTFGTTGSRHSSGPSSSLATGSSANVQAPVRPAYHVIRPDALGDQPDYVDCLWCRSRQRTEVKKRNSSMTILVAVACCLMNGYICSIAALACHWCGDLEHECSGCGRSVARKPYDSRMTAVIPPPRHADQQGHTSTSIYTPASQEG